MTTTTSNIPKCIICGESKFYQDKSGIWHNCPRCHPI